MKVLSLLPIICLCLLPACNPAHPVPIDRPDHAAIPLSTATASGTLALIKLQHPNGSFAGPNGADHVGITAIAGLALLSAGDVAPSTLAPHINDAATYIFSKQNTDGYLVNEGDSAGMYGHAFATLFLTQLHSTTTDPAKKQALVTAIESAVHLIETAQSKEGGWRYTPKPADADVSITAAVLKALVAAKQQGFAVPDATLTRAISYLKSAQQPDGGFAYTIPGGGSGWARSAAATAALLYAGAGGGQDTNNALDYLRVHDGRSADFHFYYGNYYFAQTLNLEPDKANSTVSLRASLLARQNPSGLWSGESGDAYATSMALIILYMPTTHLPAFKTK